MASEHKVIVFGPTGAVGSAAARTAAQLGAKVVLAMRDTSKAIPGLDAATEKAAGFERVSADLTKPDTVAAAVKQTGAKHAFFYLSFGMPNGMLATVEALKSAGVEHAVFLSSFTIQTELTAVPADDLIPYAHAQVEISLEKVFGPDNFIAARPGSFASNTLEYKSQLDSTVGIFKPQARVDCIVPEDIGRVCGTVLAKGRPADGKRHLFLYGPELLTQVEVVNTLGRTLGKSPQIKTISAEEFEKSLMERLGRPAVVAKYMVRKAEETVKADSENTVFGAPVDRTDLSNVEKYSGKKSTTYVEWIEQNKHLWV